MAVDVEDMEDVRDAARIAGMMPYLAEDLNKMMDAVRNKAFSALIKNNLSPDEALNLWLEYHSLHKLLKRMEQRVKIGQSIGSAIGGSLNI